MDTTPPVNDGIFSNPYVAIGLPKVTALLAGALGTYAAISPDQANTLAAAITSGVLALGSVVWSYLKHRNSKAVVAAVAAAPAAPVITTGATK